MPLPGLLRRDRKSETNLRRRSIVHDFLQPTKTTNNDDHGGQQPPRISTSSDAPSAQPPISPDGSIPSPDMLTAPTTPISNGPPSASTSLDQVNLPPPTHPRFTLMRSRHASDSQLSVRSKQQSTRDTTTPPVPDVPPSTFYSRPRA